MYQKKDVNSDFGKPFQNTLWTKEHSYLAKITPGASFSGSLVKLSKNKTQCKDHYYVLRRSKLYCSKHPNSERTIAYLDINFAKIRLPKTLDADKEVFRVDIVKQTKVSQFIMPSRKVLNEFLAAVKPFVFQTDFDDKYTTVKVLGQGSFASVHLCEDRNTKKQVAVKRFMKSEIKTNKESYDMIINEIEILRQLNHPNTVKLREVYDSPDSINVVMDLFEGITLTDYMNTQKEMPLSVSCVIMEALLDTLIYLEKAGIVHRDIKPSNIILKAVGDLKVSDVKLVDFGFATKVNISEYVVQQCGTPGYIAPETFELNTTKYAKVTSKCDVYSLGCLFYYLLVKKNPFYSDTLDSILQKNAFGLIDFNHPQILKPLYLKLLLCRMLDTNLLHRFNPQQALDHKFFALQKRTFKSNFRISTCKKPNLAYKVDKESDNRQFSTTTKNEDYEDESSWSYSVGSLYEKDMDY